MAYCLQCGHAAQETVPAGDTKLRLVCPSCGYIHYENPKLICGALVRYQGKILLCRRGIEPRYGYWTLPAGFMEIGETLLEGALRETFEEACAIATNAHLYCLFDIPMLGQVHAMFLADLHDEKFGAGSESLECALFDEADIPWDELAFETIHRTLKAYLADKSALSALGKDTDDNANFALHQIHLDKSGD